MRPPHVDRDFIKSLTTGVVSKAQLSNFIREYAFVTQSLDDEEFYPLPGSVPPKPFEVSQFATEELAIIDTYKLEAGQMKDSKKEQY